MAVRFVLNRQGVAELLKSPEVLAFLEQRAQAIAAAAGPDMEVESMIGRSRARASVYTATIDAMLAERNYQDLTRAIDAGRA